MPRQDQVTSRVNVLDIIAEEPAYVLLAQRAVRPDGKQRTITQKLRVRDANVLARLTSQIHKGDEIDADIVTEWSKTGYAAYLSDFHMLTPPTSEAPALLFGAAKSS